MALTNAELTQQLQLMQQNLIKFESRLGDILPRIDKSIEKKPKTMNDDLAQKTSRYLTPLIEMDLKHGITEMDST